MIKRLLSLVRETWLRPCWSFLSLNNIRPSEIEVYNRTVENAEALAKEFPQVLKVGSVKEMEKSKGEIFVNGTYVGSPWVEGESYLFKDQMVSNFSYIADVTFVPLKPQLIELGERLGKAVSPGWKMFLYQGKMCLEKILNIDVDEKVLAKHVVNDFKHNWS